MQAISNFIISSYPQAEAILLGGSYIKGTFDHYSDFDFTIVTEGSEQKFESHNFNGKKIDLCFWGIDHLKSKIQFLDYLNPNDQELAYIITYAKILAGEGLIKRMRTQVSKLTREEVRKVGIKTYSIINNNKLEAYFYRRNSHKYLLEICELNQWMTLLKCNLNDQFYQGSPPCIHPELKRIQNLNYINESLIKKSVFKLRNEICTSLNTLLLTTSNLEAPKSKMPKPYLISSNSIDIAWSRHSTGFMA